MRPFIYTVAIGCCLFVLNANANAHMAFKKTISKKYPELKITCNACHVKDKKKTVRNDFGKLFHKELKEKEITAGFKSKEGAERKQFEKEVMIPEFIKALEKVKKMKPADVKNENEGENKEVDFGVESMDTTFDELIKAGKMPEITKKPESSGGSEKKSEK